MTTAKQRQNSFNVGMVTALVTIFGYGMRINAGYSTPKWWMFVLPVVGFVTMYTAHIIGYKIHT